MWPLILLTGTAASADAISYLGLGHVFPANMTGNTVLLAVGLASGKHAAAIRSAVALGSFVVGAAAAARGGSPRGWSRRLVWPLLGELALLVAAAVWWGSLDAKPGGAPRYALIALFSVAMGVQSAVVTQLGLGVSTTYVTGTWTSVSRWVARTVTRRPADDAASSEDPPAVKIVVLACYFGVALGAGYCYHVEGAYAVIITAGTAAAAAVGAGRAACAQWRDRASRARSMSAANGPAT